MTSLEKLHHLANWGLSIRFPWDPEPTKTAVVVMSWGENAKRRLSGALDTRDQTVKRQGLARGDQNCRWPDAPLLLWDFTYENKNSKIKLSRILRQHLQRIKSKPQGLSERGVMCYTAHITGSWSYLLFTVDYWNRFNPLYTNRDHQAYLRLN